MKRIRYPMVTFAKRFRYFRPRLMLQLSTLDDTRSRNVLNDVAIQYSKSFDLVMFRYCRVAKATQLSALARQSSIKAQESSKPTPLCHSASFNPSSSRHPRSSHGDQSSSSVVHEHASPSSVSAHDAHGSSSDVRDPHVICYPYRSPAPGSLCRRQCHVDG